MMNLKHLHLFLGNLNKRSLQFDEIILSPSVINYTDKKGDNFKGVDSIS